MKPVVASLCIIGLVLTGCGEQQPVVDEKKLASARQHAAHAEHEWRSYLGDTASNQYSPLEQINRDNVAGLREAWRYDPGDAGDFDTLIPTNPLIVEGVLYGLSARKNLFALDAASGEELWVHRFDRPHEGKGAGRGLVFWRGQDRQGHAASWILVGLGHDLYAVDADTGQLVSTFGNSGSVDLRAGLDRPIDAVNIGVIAPGTLYGDLLIQGFGTSEFYDAAPGYIRAYHLPSGELRWTFRTIPAAGEFGADTWPAENREQFGGANSWAGITLDEERGIAFVPTGSAAYDYYGGNRKGDNLFANSLIALDANTGERLWHYQFVRHDLWDRDLPTPPNLITVEQDGKRIPAISQATKSGHLFIFNRETGEPLLPMQEIPVTGTGAPGDHPAASQPVPDSPEPFARQRFEISTVDPASTEYIAALIEGMASNSAFHAADESGLVIYPGLDGGAQWGGQAYDAERQLLVLNTNEVPWYYSMVPVTEGGESPYSIEFAYLHYCGSCHGADRKGNGDIFPALTDIGDKYWPWEVWDIIRNGRGRMPAFGKEPWYYMLGPLAYLYSAEEDQIAQRAESGEVSSYISDGFHVLYDEFGLPGSQPPWGSLVAIDLARMEIAWKVPLGDYPQALARGLSGLGAENYGGPVATAGGLLFIGATPDSMFRAFDTSSGQVLWQTELPAAGFATPAVYAADGKQFVVIAAGGGKIGQASGSAYVAYALPQDGPEQE